MPTNIEAAERFNREYLGIRARLIEVAAALDRIDRGPGSIAADPRLANIHRSLEVLAQAEAGRAEQLQMLFSLAYDPDWKPSYGIAQG